ncbi:hypothetical protein GOB15_23785 [Sinorhizobium meliloti]|nr:hypothetical protein [Sinorhizobium meliloti]MDW9512858.1 hypothetical protein [Sinorhizobium meliloti]
MRTISAQSLDTAIEDAYNAMALLDVAIHCTGDLSEILALPHNQTMGSLSRLMRIARVQVETSLNTLEKVQMSGFQPS